MQLQNAMTASLLMQTIDVLSNHTVQMLAELQLRKCGVSDIGFRNNEVLMSDRLLPPVLVPIFRVGAKVVEIDGPIFGPDSAGGTKIRDTTFRTNPSACESVS